MRMLGMTADAVSETLPWWALYTKHQHEKVVADALTAKGFEVFLPMYESVRIWKDRKKAISLPLFQCYVFVRGTLDRRLQVMTTPGVFSILSRGEQVSTIPEIEIAAIQRSVAGNMRMEPHPFLSCGDRVRVIRGALEGVTGILIRKKGLCRLVLSVDTLAQSIAVEIPTSDVEPEVHRFSEAATSLRFPVQPAAGLTYSPGVEVFGSKTPSRARGGGNGRIGTRVSA
jgi:transcription antitermination factor NusG